MENKPKRVSGVLDGWLTKKPLPTTGGSSSPLVNRTFLKKAVEDVKKESLSTSPSTKPETSIGRGHHHESKVVVDEPSPHKRKSEESPPRSSRKRLRGSSPSSAQRKSSAVDEEEPPSIRPRKRRARLAVSSDDEEDVGPPQKKAAISSHKLKDEPEAKAIVKVEVSPRKVTGRVPGSTGSRGSPKAKAKAKAKQEIGNDVVPGALPLEGKKVVVTGVFDTTSRSEVELHIKRIGGQVTTAVSGRTDMLVHGSVLEDGRPFEAGTKYRTAVALKEGMKLDGKKTKAHSIDILSEEEFYEKYRIASPPQSSPPSSPPPSHVTPVVVLSDVEVKGKGVVRAAAAIGGIKNQQLWSEKWRPERIEEILGNGESVKKLLAWLRDWHDVCILGKKKEAAKSRGGEPERINARAAILSGPPGVGKTTAARVAATTCGYEIIEYNASDDRGKSIVDVLNDMTSGGQTLGSFIDHRSPKRAVLIMDEMDGLSGNSDRGGVQALMKLIEKAHCPIICICNDRMHPKLRTLFTKCYDLRFNKPPKNTVAKRICEIAKKERLNVEYNAAELLCERVGNDLRQMLNMLQLMGRDSNDSMASSPSDKVSFDSMRKEIGYGLKDSQVMANPFDTAKRLLCKSDIRNTNFNEKQDLYFVDYDIMPLYIQENYISAYSYQPVPPERELEAIGTLSEVADCFTFGDMLSSKTRREGQWALLGDVGLYTAVVPACKASGFLARPEFPKWLGRNSTTTKNRRLLNELQLYLAPLTTTTPLAMRTSGYVDLVYERILAPLTNSSDNTKDQAQRCMELMDEYGLTKDQVVENLGSLRFKKQDKLYDLVDSSVKRSLTTLYNASSHAIKMAPPMFSVKKGAGVKGPSKETEDGGDEGSAPNKDEKEEPEQSQNEVVDEEYLDRLFLAKKKKGAIAKRAATAKTKAKGKAAPKKAKSSPKRK